VAESAYVYMAIRAAFWMALDTSVRSPIGAEPSHAGVGVPHDGGVAVGVLDGLGAGLGLAVGVEVGPPEPVSDQTETSSTHQES
jgi:hypothetical protein